MRSELFKQVKILNLVNEKIIWQQKKEGRQQSERLLQNERQHAEGELSSLSEKSPRKGWFFCYQNINF